MNRLDSLKEELSHRYGEDFMLGKDKDRRSLVIPGLSQFLNEVGEEVKRIGGEG